ncbi:MAG: hypothetical protein OH319_02180 [Candidatus Parvarchaeota archaeon]|nr:hypothetical protein [Candidatus Jingweiarchaeum tengchongense]MCW1298176.1 hypothetical protein [Candidatus Jingweiarchaeum tengchongense]MCW1299974.1 hypothetical protein [Candidatus Jingweiarchaeum tengchongense]MCW1305036.1 hypothetical protein [Candidatus Jingweiarchaeum tengchongense]MCW1305477.1 hypothetical protein [Candidatus Jingweiarchaeum tengchongense]
MPVKRKKIFIICPVRGAKECEIKELEEYVSKLESNGHKVYYPPRDTKQDDPIGIRICSANKKAVMEADEVHVYWDDESEGSRFDLGMAFMANKPIILINKDRIKPTPRKSFKNVLLALDSKHKKKQKCF